MLRWANGFDDFSLTGVEGVAEVLLRGNRVDVGVDGADALLLLLRQPTSVVRVRWGANSQGVLAVGQPNATTFDETIKCMPV